MNAQISINGNTIVKELVAMNFQTAKIFEKYGIDFCCNGNRSLLIAADESKISVTDLIIELNEASKVTEEQSDKFNKWELNVLSEYIVNKHHSYVKAAIPRIQEHLNKVENKHGENHRFMITVSKLFQQISIEMINHMSKEEKIIFHIIKYLEGCKSYKEKPRTGGYGTIKNPINTLEIEHNGAGIIMAEIRNLTNNYILPVDACVTFTLTYKELEEFELDLHKHVHLENNILFPKAIKLEDELLKL